MMYVWLVLSKKVQVENKHRCASKEPFTVEKIRGVDGTISFYSKEIRKACCPAGGFEGVSYSNKLF